LLFDAISSYGITTTETQPFYNPLEAETIDKGLVMIAREASHPRSKPGVDELEMKSHKASTRI
jgi:hypothetical protein